MAERGTGRFFAVHEKTREFRKTWIMPDDQQGFYGWGYAFQKVLHVIGIAAVERIFNFIGGFLRNFPQHDLERAACAKGRRHKDKIGNESGGETISAHTCRIGAALSRQWPFKIALGSVSGRFCMANEEEPGHRAS